MRQRLSVLKPSVLPTLRPLLCQPARGLFYVFVALITVGIVSLSAAGALGFSAVMFLLQCSALLAVASVSQLLIHSRLQPVQLRRAR